jgi:outer membrane lipopolysaccharide assembly protein LptE/RlpB|tara:strand:- start:386 stop:850 length:465 start_codon:yes stop_codon:yes gene_type:complete
MQKKIFLLLFFLLLSSCGYEAIYSKKNSINYNFSISKLEFVGDKDINLRMREKLVGYTQNKKNKNFRIKISSISTKAVAANDTAGDATRFKNTVTINVEISTNDKLKNSFVMSENFNYNNNSDKFSLKRYEREIKNNLAETISDKLIFKLSNIQ